MTINSRLFDHSGLAFDPYPFIFLNLMLSMLAAIQPPVIMMSKNRQPPKARRTENPDYEITLPAGLKIMRFHKKTNQLQINALPEKVNALRASLDPHRNRGHKGTGDIERASPGA